MKAMMKILIFITLINFGFGWTAEAKNKYKPHFMDCPFGLKVQPIGDMLQLVARAGTLGVVKINQYGDVTLLHPGGEVSDLSYVSNVISVGRTGKIDKDDARGSRTIALLPYKGNFLWLVEAEQGDMRTHLLLECLVTKDLDKTNPTYKLSEIFRTVVAYEHDSGVEDRAPNYTGASIYGNTIYFARGDRATDCLRIDRYTLDTNGSPYYNQYSEETQMPPINLKPPVGIHGKAADTLLTMSVRAKDGGYELITVWTQYQEYGFILAAYNLDGNHPSPVVTSAYMTDYKSSYYSADIFPYPLQCRATKGNEYTVLIGAHNKIWAYTVLNENGMTSFEGKSNDNLITSKVKPNLSEICAVLYIGQSYSQEPPTQEPPKLYVRIYVYGVKFDNHNDDSETLSDNYYRVITSQDRLYVGYLVAAKPSNLISNTKKEPGALNVNHSAGVVPIGIIYPPPFILPKDLVGPLDPPVSGYAKNSELLDDPQLMELLNDNRAYESFVQAYKVTYPSKDPVRFKWLFTSDGQSFLDAIVPVFVLEPTGDALKINARSELELGGSFPESLLAVKYKKEIEKGTLDTTLSEKITCDYKGEEYGHINNNAIFVYWKYPESSIFMYDVELYSREDVQLYTNPLKFKVLAYTDKPDLKQLPFNSKIPDANNVLLSGIKPVPQSYEVLKSDGSLAQDDYEYLIFWGNYVNKWPWSSVDDYMIMEQASLDVTDENSHDVESTWSFSNFRHNLGVDDAGTYSGGVSWISPYLSELYREAGTQDSYFEATQATSTSVDTELGFTVPSQCELTSAVGTKDSPEGGKLTFDSLLKYRYYMIKKCRPSADYNDWWVADIWREKGIAPWVLYYSTNLEDRDPRD